MREVFLLFYYQRYTIEEIAKILDVQAGTVSSRLSRGRKKLKVLLEEGEAQNGLTRLPQVAEETLGGLKADASAYENTSAGSGPGKETCLPPAASRCAGCSFVLVITLGVIGIGGICPAMRKRFLKS